MRTAVIGISGSEYLAASIAEKLDQPVWAMERRQFGDGERYFRLEVDPDKGWEEMSGRDVVVVGTTYPDSNFFEIVSIVNLVQEMGAHSVVVCLPWFAYGTMERAKKAGEAITAKTAAMILSHSVRNPAQVRYLLTDLHASTIVQMFESPCIAEQIYAQPVLLEGIEKWNLPNLRIGTTDEGRPDWVRSYARQLGLDPDGVIVASKTREGETVRFNTLRGERADLTGCSLLMYDDMVRGAGTATLAAEAYAAAGAEPYLVCSHLALTGPKVVKRLEDSPIRRILCTDSHPMSQIDEVKRSAKIQVVGLTDLYALKLLTILR